MLEESEEVGECIVVCEQACHEPPNDLESKIVLVVAKICLHTIRVVNEVTSGEEFHESMVNKGIVDRDPAAVRMEE